jgi:hypothetical protein
MSSSSNTILSSQPSPHSKDTPRMPPLSRLLIAGRLPYLTSLLSILAVVPVSHFLHPKHHSVMSSSRFASLSKKPSSGTWPLSTTFLKDHQWSQRYTIFLMAVVFTYMDICSLDRTPYTLLTQHTILKMLSRVTLLCYAIG